MDDSLKARLIGAAILVALAVLLIPELLSGRKPASAGASEDANGRATRTVVIDLTGATPGQVAAAPSGPGPGEPSQTLLPTPKPETVPAAEQAPETVAEAAPPERKPEPVVQQAPTPAPATPPPAAEPKPTKAAGRGGWVVQVGAFGASGTAARLVAELKGAGYPAFVSPISKGGKTLHRVRVGPVAERAEADTLAGRLKGRSLPATVVAND